MSAVTHSKPFTVFLVIGLIGLIEAPVSRSLVAGDFNNDGRLDFVLTSQGNTEVEVLLNSSPTPPKIFIEEGTINKAAALGLSRRYVVHSPFLTLTTSAKITIHV